MDRGALDVIRPAERFPAWKDAYPVVPVRRGSRIARVKDRLAVFVEHDFKVKRIGALLCLDPLDIEYLMRRVTLPGLKNDAFRGLGQVAVVVEIEVERVIALAWIGFVPGHRHDAFVVVAEDPKGVSGLGFVFRLFFEGPLDPGKILHRVFLHQGGNGLMEREGQIENGLLERRSRRLGLRCLFLWGCLAFGGEELAGRDC